MQRPKTVAFACADLGWYATRMRWTQWGGSVAVGTGTQYENTCTPDCADGRFVATPVTVRLYLRRPCAGKRHLYYQRATVIAASGKRTRAVVGCPIA